MDGMPKKRDWSCAPDQACSRCGKVARATPEFFGKAYTFPLGVSSVCVECGARRKAPVPEGMKRCVRCREVLPAERYSPCKATRDRLRPYCKACACAEAKDYRAANPEKVKAQQVALRPYKAGWVRDWRRVNPDAGRAQYAKYRAANPERVREAAQRFYVKHGDRIRAASRERMREYYRLHPEVVIRNSMAQRTKRRTHELSFIDGQFLRTLFQAQGGRCLYCSERIGKGGHAFHVDHFIPLSRGGDNDRTNLCLACQPCNSSKYNKMPWDWQPDRYHRPLSS